MAPLKKLKTKLNTAILFLVLVLGVQRMSSCNKPCTVEKDCGFTSTTINAIDTIYYPYVSDFANEGKIYTYEITVDSKTFIRSYKMSTFEHHYETEFNYYNRDDCSIALPCDTTIKRWYEMNSSVIDHDQSGLQLKLGSGHVMNIRIWDKEFALAPIEIYTDLYSNFNKITVKDSHSNEVTTSRWVQDTVIQNYRFEEVTIWQYLKNNETIQLEVFNKLNSLIHYKNKSKDEEIKLTNIQ